MIKFLQNLFVSAEKLNIEDMLARGAVIIDVRTPREFQSGHIKNSKNIPLDKLAESISKLDKNKPVITCCASGGRSGAARRFLMSNGFLEVINAGNWNSLRPFEK